MITTADEDVRRIAVTTAVAGEARSHVTTRDVGGDGLADLAVDVDVDLNRADGVRVERPTRDADHAGTAHCSLERADRVATRRRRTGTVHEDLGDPHLALAVGDADPDPLEGSVHHVGVVLR